jgi:phospholipid/cholesterol/gamma-HCH transport system substrate-binding protein
MTFKFRYADRIVGIFVLIAILFVVFMLVIAGLNRQWFAHQYHYTTRFTSAAGLSVGKSISFKGVDIGEIKAFRLNEENLVDAEFVIYEEYIDKLKPDSVLQLATNPLGIGGGLILRPGANTRPSPAEGSFIPSTQLPEGLGLIESGKVTEDGGSDIIGELMAGVPQLLSHIDEAVLGINDLVGTLNLSLKGEKPYGALGAVLSEAEQLIVQVDTLVAQVSTLLESITKPEDLLPALVGNEGIAGGLFSNDAEFYGEITGITDELLGSLVNLNSLTCSLNSYSPQIDLLLTKISTAITRAEDVLESLANNPLLRDGVEERIALPATGGSTIREEEF